MKSSPPSRKYHPLLIPEDRFDAQCRAEFLRRSGPGGQHRNKVETAVRLLHLPTGIVGEASERRSQAENRKVARNRLRLRLALRVRSQQVNPLFPDQIDSPLLDSRAVWNRYRTGDRIRISETNPDFPIVIMEFFDVWETVRHDWGLVAAELKTTVSQLHRLVGQKSESAQAVRQDSLKWNRETLPESSVTKPVMDVSKTSTPRANPIRTFSEQEAFASMTTQTVEFEMKWDKALIALGANLGDRETNLCRAWERLGKLDGIRPRLLSRLIETPPVGGPPNQPPFLNAVGLIETNLAPEELLDRMNAVEKEGGRERHEFWGARTVDLDLLLFGGHIIRSRRLTVPHPRMVWRPFVLIPAREIAPDFLHPVFGQTVAELARLLEMNFRLSAIPPLLGRNGPPATENVKPAEDVGNIGISEIAEETRVPFT